MKKIVKILNGMVRLFFGFCPKCNSDAPKLYDCNVCEWYRISEKGMPSIKIKRVWWKRFINDLKTKYDATTI